MQSQPSQANQTSLCEWTSSLRATQAGRSLRPLGEKGPRHRRPGGRCGPHIVVFLRWHSGSADHTLVGFHPGTRAQGIAGTRAQRTIERWNLLNLGCGGSRNFYGGMLVFSYGEGNADVHVYNQQKTPHAILFSNSSFRVAAFSARAA